MSPMRVVKVPALFPHQREIVMNRCRTKVACLGRQAGKTLLGGVASLFGHGPLDANGVPKFKGALFGKDIQWTSKDFTNTDKIWKDLKLYLSSWGGELDKSEVHRRIGFPGGGSIVIRSAHEPDSLRGPTIDGAINDELAFWHPESLETLRPALAVKQGWEIDISTPYGFNWFFEEWRRGHENIDPDYAAWQWPSTINPAFTREEFERIRAKTRPSVFAREYLAEFSIGEGEIFRRDWFRHFHEDEHHLHPELGEKVAKSELQTYLSADFALTKKDYSDYTAIAVTSATEDGRLFMRDLMRVKVSRAELPALIRRTQDRWGARFVYVESSGELANLNDECRRAGVLIRERKIHQVFDGKKGEDKVTRAQEASRAVELGKISFLKRRQPNGAFAPDRWVGDLVTECCAFPPPSGKGNDDQVDALSLAVLGYPFLSFRASIHKTRPAAPEDRPGWQIGRD